MDFLRFVREHLAASVVAVVGAMLAVVGVVMDGIGVYQLGLPGWVFAVAGMLIFFASTILLLFRFQQRLPRMGTPEEDDPNWQDKLQQIVNKHFYNTEVRLDGKRFVNCEFQGVTFLYNGGPVAMSGNRIGQHTIRTERPEIERFVSLMMQMGHVSSPVLTNEGIKTLAQLDAENRNTRGRPKPDGLSA